MDKAHNVPRCTAKSIARDYLLVRRSEWVSLNRTIAIEYRWSRKSLAEVIWRSGPRGQG
jgi:hypothetical protein